MKRFIREYLSGRFLVPVLVAAILAGCGKDSPKRPLVLDDFIRKEECGLVGYGGYLFKYSQEDCQLSINARRKQVRMQNDDQTDYVQVVFSRMPGKGDFSSDVHLWYKLGADEITSVGKMDIVRFSDSKVWLWDNGRNIGVILPLIR